MQNQEEIARRKRAKNRLRTQEQNRNARKNFGKCGHKLVNIIIQSRIEKDKFELDKQYAQ
jgi:hypothetical protein